MIPGNKVKRAIEVVAGDNILYHRKWVRVRSIEHDWVDQYYRVIIRFHDGTVLSLPADNTVDVRVEPQGIA